MRSGLIAEKIGMTQAFLSGGGCVPLTVLKVEDCVVIEKRIQEQHGYTALVLGSQEVSLKRLAKSQVGYFKKQKQPPKNIVKEFRVTSENQLALGHVLRVDHFKEGQLVDVTGISIGKGFAGAMKRHNFSGLRASHGVSVSHRSHGSTGQCQDPGRVFKNKKMAGHMGNNRVTKLNLSLVEIDTDRGLLFVKGAVPGHKGSVVYVRDAIKSSQLS